MGQVGDGGLQTGAVGGQLLGQQVEHRPGPPGIGRGGEGVQVAHRPLLQHLPQLLGGAGEVGQIPRQLAPLHQGLGVLPQLPQVVLPPLGHPAALAENHHRVLRQVVRRRGHLGVDEAYIPVHGREGGTGVQPLPVLLQSLDQLFRPLPLTGTGDQLVQALQQPRPAAGGELGQHLGGGQDLRLADVLDAPLGVRVEEAHGIHFVPEELHTHRLLMGGREEVQNAPPQGKLAHALHLLAPGVPGGGEGFGKLVQVMGLPHPHHLGGLGEQGLGDGALEEGLYRTHQQGALPRRQRPQDGQPPVLILPGYHRRVVEGELPGGQGGHLLPGEGGQVLLHPLGLPLVGAHHHHRPLQLLVEPGGKVGPVDRRQAGKGHRAGPVVDGRRQGTIFRDILQRGQQLFHGTPRRYRKIWKL